MSAVADAIRAEVIPHIDDIGVTLGSVTAMDELAGSGFVTSGSIMVPCPWFPAAAEPDVQAALCSANGLAFVSLSVSHITRPAR